MDIKVLGIDLGKTVCSLAGLDEAGAVVFRKRLQRHRLLGFLDTLPPCVVAMEACGGAHHIGRFLPCIWHNAENDEEEQESEEIRRGVRHISREPGVEEEGVQHLWNVQQ